MQPWTRRRSRRAPKSSSTSPPGGEVVVSPHLNLYFQGDTCLFLVGGFPIDQHRVGDRAARNSILAAVWTWASPPPARSPAPPASLCATSTASAPACAASPTRLGLNYQTLRNYKAAGRLPGLRSILLTLAFTLLSGAKNPHRLGYLQLGELGALLGLDRSPCTRTLRHCTKLLAADQGALTAWRDNLAEQWVSDSLPAHDATLLLDGHVQSYGGKGRLPKQFVPR